MARASFKIEIAGNESEMALKRASDYLESLNYDKIKSGPGRSILLKKGYGWPVVPKYIEIYFATTTDNLTHLKREGHIPAAIFHETFKIGELPFTDKPTLTINVNRKEGYRDLMALKEHLVG